jgi:hypothetical protein
MYLTMETYPIIDKTRGNRPFAFEIENAYVDPGTITHLLKAVVGVSHVRERSLFAKPAEIHAEFRYMNRDYVVWAPNADNTRYWIGPKSARDGLVSIDMIEKAFKLYRPPLHKRLLGDFLSLGLVKQIVGP